MGRIQSQTLAQPYLTQITFTLIENDFYTILLLLVFVCILYFVIPSIEFVVLQFCTLIIISQPYFGVKLSCVCLMFA